jgi:hypothetical protein
MKKQIVSGCLISLVLLSLFSGPPSAAGNVNFGLKLGYNSLQLRAKEGVGSINIERLSLGGACAGLVMNYDLGRFLILQAEATYFQKGGKYDLQVPIPTSVVSVEVRETRRLAYIEIPLLLKFAIPLQGAFRPTLLIGPSMGINLSSKLDSLIRVKILGVGLDLDEKRGIDIETNATELSLVVGGGFDLKLSTGKIIADARLCFGLTPFEYKVTIPTSKFASLGLPTMPDIYYNLEMSNYVFSVSIGYLF